PVTQVTSQVQETVSKDVTAPDVYFQFVPEQAVLAPVVPEPAPIVAAPIKAKPVVKKVPPPVAKKPSEPPVAVIIAKPAKGYSPLKVNFSGQRSSSKSGKIISYEWDFGDGDTSTKKNTENTYWSTVYGLRTFTVTLTVKDDKGLTSSTTTAIELSTH
ncbi:MAG: PKD domain-containing protein, partial [Candidatus Omnitrophota bacterium]